MSAVMSIEEIIEQIKTLKTKVDALYIYGTGMYGQTVYKTLCKYKIEIDGFVESSKRKEYVLSKKVYNAKDISKNRAGVVLGLNEHNAKEVMEYLNSIGFDRNNIIDGGVTTGGKRHGFNERPAISLTTVIGCKVNCNLCPQNILISNYFKYDKNREREMTVETFSICLERLPQDCSILFCGMSEPFLNKNCLRLMEMAVEAGRSIDLNTTLVGLNMQMVKELVKLPIGFVTLHVADTKNYAKIPLTEEYFEMVQFVIDYKREDGTPFVNLCNSQTMPNERIQEICNKKYEILTAMHDRAGNLDSEGLLSAKQQKGVITCGLSGTKFNRNVLLPDGTLLLCDNDYGMKHVLGNLLTDTYEDLMNGEEMLRIKRGCKTDESDVLCRLCPFANSKIND